MFRTSNFCWSGVKTQPSQKSGRLEQHHFFNVEDRTFETPPPEEDHVYIYISLYSSWFWYGFLNGWYFLGGHFQT